ncbi:MAG: hypothetical protein ACR2PM_11230 [Hyphomicrobiales bacterium]
MIELILSVCLIGQAETCKDVHLTYTAETVTAMQCLMGGQPQVARWIEGHPKWAVKRWKCGRIRVTQNSI